MSLPNQRPGERISDASTQSPRSSDYGRRRRGLVNWALALLTVPAALLVMMFAVGAAMSIAACSGAQCPHLGPSGIVYGVLLYGAPVVAALTIVVSCFTAFRRLGFLVPVSGFALLLADVVVTAMLFRT
ncbi:hypothetical protein MSIMFB_03135 [Mycobacterium simulans]|uniref:Transmembrane protein n=1 Tax=Mycobacterium simulans TaxID=627089 RepID=A0A7Z7INQ4_9MYCO|nr:hypothetical protein [Mycobacterium simulans]SOJ55653.1 hypothetical protein MSIMFB_03135 [Mycobacterium simulans]